MSSHQVLDRRSLAFAEAIAAKIDADPTRAGLALARENCQRWLLEMPSPAIDEWRVLLEQDWSQVRAVLLQENDEGQRLRQSSPFTGILSREERREIIERFRCAV